MSKIALVTGTSSGIGLSTAVLLAKSGFTTVATVRDVNKAEALRERAQREGVSLDIRRLDVGDQASVEGCVRETLAQYGRVDVLVNNAGVGHKGTLEQITIEELQQTLDVNFFGVARVTRALLPAMRAAGSGRIITVTSMNGVVGIPFSDAYNASKFAVEGLMEGLAPVMARFGVRISIIEPAQCAWSSEPRGTRNTRRARPLRPTLTRRSSKRTTARSKAGRRAPGRRETTSRGPSSRPRPPTRLTCATRRRTSPAAWPPRSASIRPVTRS